MKQRSIPLLIILSLLSVGLYAIYWLVSTKNEMNRNGAQIPSAFLMLIPIVSIYWMWKYCEGVALVTRKELSAPVAFLLLSLLSIVGMCIVQATLNKVPPSHEAALPQARVA